MKYMTNQQVINLSNGSKTLSRSTSSRSADSSKGFSAVELLITLFIAVAFLISGYQLYALVIKDGGEARMQSKAGNIAADYLQRYKTSATNPCTSQTPLTDSSVTIDGFPVIISVALSCPYPDSSSTSVSKVSVTIKYGTPQKVITNATYVTP